MIIQATLKDWLLDSDVSLQYLVYKNLLEAKQKPLDKLQSRIPLEGWGKAFMEARNSRGSWGNRYYQPKWACSHYVLFDLKLMGFPPNDLVKKIVLDVLTKHRSPDGGINISSQIKPSDVCVNGMVLNFSAYFLGVSDHFHSLIDYFLDMQMEDGGFNCEKISHGARHSSVHTTLSVLEGLLEYKKAGNTYKIDDVTRMEEEAFDFLLVHHFFLSHKTLQVIHRDMTTFTYPYRYRLDALRALEYVVEANRPYDDRMQEALDLLLKRRSPDGKWKNNGIKPGQTLVVFEENGSISRINTYRCLRVLKYFKKLGMTFEF